MEWASDDPTGLAEEPGLLKDPGGLIDLPPGFQYRVLSAEDSTLPNGSPVPGDYDGMTAFQGRGDTVLLVRNHELTGAEGPPVIGANPYDRESPGGTTGVVVGADRRKIEEFVTSSGTRTNCAGGKTPWGTWLTCEENRTEGHGYVFEVMPEEPENALSRTPIEGMGFFSHEALGIDPRNGIAYLTEDHDRGLFDASERAKDRQASFLYRYLPHDRSRRPGALQKGGTLQALAIEERSSRQAHRLRAGKRFGVIWKDVRPSEARDDALAKGAVRFKRLEGAYFASRAFWFDDTSAGENRLGRIYRYLPATETLELFYEATRADRMNGPDNIVVTPWGDLWFAEDGGSENRIMGITPTGEVYEFASTSLNGSEFAGPTFAPDGRTFFVNIQRPPITFAIWGPFARRRANGGWGMATAEPPSHLAPRTSGELAEAGARYGLTPLETAAYDRLAVDLS